MAQVVRRQLKNHWQDSAEPLVAPAYGAAVEEPLATLVGCPTDNSDVAKPTPSPDSLFTASL